MGAISEVEKRLFGAYEALSRVAAMRCASPMAGQPDWYADCRERDQDRPAEERQRYWCARCVAAEAFESMQPPLTLAQVEWAVSGAKGTSSLMLWSTLSGVEVRGFVPFTPADSGDFGRCHRLLEQVPEWRPRLGEVAARYPAWAPLVACWDELTALYTAGRWEELTARLGEWY